ncbi:hypothetical protein AE618_11240 [Bosea vaviloviae]|uniref:Uncharacterized protein n=1 Tax=Bosea vaviloviae TaxID=1526658 RepID=A0A0N0MCA4_9HYPH|nr:hypothetical protein AE618_11240 [Bosea vaviloviae]
MWLSTCYGRSRFSTLVHLLQANGICICGRFRGRARNIDIAGSFKIEGGLVRARDPMSVALHVDYVAVAADDDPHIVTVHIDADDDPAPAPLAYALNTIQPFASREANRLVFGNAFRLKPAVGPYRLFRDNLWRVDLQSVGAQLDCL